MLKEVVEAHADAALSVHVVWMPMVPGDSREAAQQTGSMFPPDRVHQYYDADHLAGEAYVRDAFASCLADAFKSTPEDHPLHAQLEAWSKSGRPAGPLWDAVLFYPPGLEWADKAPTPQYWSKQVMFFGADAGTITGTFFHNDCKHPPADSDWFREVKSAITKLLSSTDASGSRP